MSFEKVSHYELEKVEEKIGDLSSLPTTDKSSLVAAMSETFQSVSNGKALVASAITDKGVSTSSDAAFAQMAQNIASIPTGGGGAITAKCFTKPITSDKSSTNVQFNPEGDADIAAHRNDSTFVVGFIATSPVSNKSVRASFVGANNLSGVHDCYGVYLRSSTSGSSGVGLTKLARDEPNTSVGTISVDSNGVVSVYVNSEYPLRAGNYIIIAGW